MNPSEQDRDSIVEARGLEEEKKAAAGHERIYRQRERGPHLEKKRHPHPGRPSGGLLDIVREKKKGKGHFRPRGKERALYRIEK